MRMTEVRFADQTPIDSYGGGGFRLKGEFRAGGLLLTPEGVSPWPVSTVAELTAEAFAPVVGEAGAIDVLLVGMGAEIAALPAEARAALTAANIGVETMSTASACRTYNMLLSEGRRVAAALIAI